MSYEANFFFSKCLKFNVDSKTAIKKLTKIFGFPDKCIWIGSGKFYLLLREYSQLTVNVLSKFRQLLLLTCVTKIWTSSLDTPANYCLRPEISCVWVCYVMCFKDKLDLLITWSCEITWKTSYIISPVSQCLWPPNLVGWWLALRVSYRYSHLTL